ncbi:MAG: S8 family serine peptidase [Bacteroidales bacterium]|nr:S8 family serine peptidase [Bacteroidales bacterium]
MKHYYIVYLLIFVFLGNLSAQPSRRRVETGKVIVKLKPDAVPAVETGLRTLSRTSSDTSVLSIGLKSFDRINRRYKATSMRRVFPDAGKYEAKHREYGLHLWYEITIPEGEDPETAAAGYGVDGNVQTAEPRYKIRHFGMSASPPAETPNDPDFNKQWNYNNTGQTGGTPGADIRLPEAWERIKSLGIKNSNVIVAVVDAGVYYDHEDMKANMWVNEAELNGISNVDDDGNKYVDDIYGYNFVDRSDGAISPEDHATHVAGTVAAVTGNGVGVSGIAGSSAEGYGIKIMTVQILDGEKGASSIGAAYAYAADNGAVISQNSWGYEKVGEYNGSDVDAINYFIEQAGRDEHKNLRPGTPMAGGIVIFAAGNDGKDGKWYPAYFDNVLAVAATNHYGKLAWYSNFGNWIDISAPGGDTRESGKSSTGGIYSISYKTNNRNYYEYMQGTSMACPHVSGVAALILSVYGGEHFTPDMLRARLLNSTTLLTAFDPGNASKMGSGLLNAAIALAPGGVPGEVTDLTVQTVNHVSGKLAWTVPPASNGGIVSIFEVACSTGEITEDNFDKNMAVREHVSVTSGSEQTYVITGLTPLTTYHLAIRSVGNIGDKSGISNTVTMTTTGNHAPEISGFPADTTLIPYQPITLDLSGYITDSDGDELNYAYILRPRGIVNVRVRGNILTIDPQHHGSVVLQLTASDPFEETVTASVNIEVEQKYAPDKSGELLAYPNPTSDILWYSYILDESASVSVRIVSAKGLTMFQAPAEKLRSGTYYYSVNLSGWTTGVYFVQYIRDGKTVDTKKVLKQ